MLRWFRQDTPLTALARDAGISIATGYRYLHEGIDVLAAQAPELLDRIRAPRSAEGRRAWHTGEFYPCYLPQPSSPVPDGIHWIGTGRPSEVAP